MSKYNLDYRRKKANELKPYELEALELEARNDAIKLYERKKDQKVYVMLLAKYLGELSTEEYRRERLSEETQDIEYSYGR